MKFNHSILLGIQLQNPQPTKVAVSILVVTMLIAGTFQAHAEDFTGMVPVLSITSILAIIASIPVTNKIIEIFHHRWIWFLFPVTVLLLGIFQLALWLLWVACTNNNIHTNEGKSLFSAAVLSLVLSVIINSLFVRRNHNKKLWVFFPIITAVLWIISYILFGVMFAALKK